MYQTSISRYCFPFIEKHRRGESGADSNACETDGDYEAFWYGIWYRVSCVQMNCRRGPAIAATSPEVILLIRVKHSRCFAIGGCKELCVTLRHDTEAIVRELHRSKTCSLRVHPAAPVHVSLIGLRVLKERCVCVLVPHCGAIQMPQCLAVNG